MWWWQQYDCPNCGTHLCLCDCLEQQKGQEWKYLHCNQCGAMAGTKCDCPSPPSWFDKLMEWFRK